MSDETKVTHEEVLCVLLLYWLNVNIRDFDGMVPTDLGSPLAAALIAKRRLVDLGFAPWQQPAVKATILLRAIAAEEAADRLERAREALLDAATEMAATVGRMVGQGWQPWLDEANAMNALYLANNEWQEAQLQASSSPWEAVGLVEVTP